MSFEANPVYTSMAFAVLSRILCKVSERTKTPDLTLRRKMRRLIWVHTVATHPAILHSLTRRLSSGLEDKNKVKIRDVDIKGKYGIQNLCFHPIQTYMQKCNNSSIL